MKSIKYIILSLLVIFTAGCGQDWLDVKPSTSIETEGSIQTLAQVEFSLNGIYSMMRSSDAYSGRITYYADVTGDDMQAVSSSKRTGNYYTFSYTKDNGPRTHWSYLYSIIQNANNILNTIDKLDTSEEDEEYRDCLKGEALALRGLALFDLTRIFGYPYKKDDGASLGVPIVKTNLAINAKPARNTVKECYMAIIEDLEDAIGLLDDDFAKGRMTKAAAMSLLSRVYLYKGEDLKALNMAEEAIKVAERKGWHLWSNAEYPTAWGNDANANDPGEILFEMVITTVESQGKETMGRLNSYDGYDDMCITVSFYNFLNEDTKDVRLKLLSFDKKKYAYVNKYQPQGDEDIMNANVPILRLSETYLNAAEAAVKSGNNEKAVKYLDAIVSRANPNKTVVGKTLTLEDVLNERRKELVAEGHRMYDLMRNGMRVERLDVKNSRIASTRHFCSKDCKSFDWNYYKIVLPIPKAEMDTNPNMEPNPGY